MYSFKVGATSANLGIGFDTLGLALDIYNTYSVSLNEIWEFEGFQKEYSNVDNNLFVKAYNETLKYANISKDCLKVRICSDIPISRGLGSSANLIIAGIYAANITHDISLTKQQMFKLASELEGHPDNVAPAIFGGLCASSGPDVLKIKVDDRYKFGIIVPEIEISTSRAREVLPCECKRKDVVSNISNAVFVLKAFENYDEKAIKRIMNDKIHEPYRKQLIPHFEEIKDYMLKKGALALVISGSGSSMLVIGKEPLMIDEKIYNCTYRNIGLNLKGIIDV